MLHAANIVLTIFFHFFVCASTAYLTTTLVVGFNVCSQSDLMTFERMLDTKNAKAVVKIMCLSKKFNITFVRRHLVMSLINFVV